MGSRLTAFLVVALLGLMAGLWTSTSAPPPLTAAAGGEPVDIYLLDNGFHTDMAVPRGMLEARGGPLAEAVRGLPPGDWILVGWGDARFYVDQSPISDRLPDGARAFFRPGGNPSVVMLDPEALHPLHRFPAEGRVVLTLPAARFEAMAARIEASLTLTPDGHARLIEARPGDEARFFASRETFWIGHLCNHWTAQVLNHGGVAVRPFRSLTSGEVMRAADAAALDRAVRAD
ncbi:MAG: DUF2459 domain-containing protein [Brevundimonas sp.]|uniref:DUF2459 domain-containing protein n=1 Tax=Brevundimonas sp. TaxID=1871086 RepID=UPI00122B3375|nr:DUF2459 domain-containing protein [Brevundimonas sp.]RZJ16445.1 MAG: DUF2459 domain-containing protein [Brevundimonas sp.]